MTTETDKVDCYFCTYHYGFSDDALCAEHRDEGTSASVR